LGTRRAFRLPRRNVQGGHRRYEALALDALVAAGKIRETDRAKVIFMVNFIVKPRFDENGAVIPRNSLN
jgi:hypothetical protein